MSCLRLVELGRPGGRLDATLYKQPETTFLAQTVQTGCIHQESAAFRYLLKPESRGTRSRREDWGRNVAEHWCSRAGWVRAAFERTGWETREGRGHQGGAVMMKPRKQSTFDEGERWQGEQCNQAEKTLMLSPASLRYGPKGSFLLYVCHGSG